MIPFSKPAAFDAEMNYLSKVHLARTPWGGGEFFARASEKLGFLLDASDVLLTQSCTAALELAALGLHIQPGDEVIVPAYTFVTTASAFALRGARIVFADSEPGTLNIDVSKIEQLIGPNTKAIVVVHYGGVACDMDEIMVIAKRHNLAVVEDAAQAIGSTYKGRPLGTIGDLGCVSFHGTKNISSGEGGALLINTLDQSISDRIHMGHEKGTDRAKFLRGQVDKYTWRELGSSFIPSEFTCAILLAQLENLDLIQSRRRQAWDEYSKCMGALFPLGFSVLDQDSPGSNLHMFALIAPTPESRDRLRASLKERGVTATSHYEPLHTSPFARKHGFGGTAPIAEDLSARILRLPMWSEEGLATDQVFQAIFAGISEIGDTN